MSLVHDVVVSSQLVDSQCKHLPAGLIEENIQVEVKDGQPRFLISLKLNDVYRTHAEIVNGSAGRRKLQILICDKTDDYLDHDCDFVLFVPGAATDDSIRIARVLMTDKRFFEMTSMKELVPTVVEVIKSVNVSAEKKLPTLATIYKASKVEITDSALRPDVQKTLFASMLRQINRISDDIARSVVNECPTLSSFMSRLPTIDSLMIRSSKGERRLGPSLADKLRLIFGDHLKSSDLVESAD